jgi:hypothetical protein
MLFSLQSIDRVVGSIESIEKRQIYMEDVLQRLMVTPAAAPTTTDKTAKAISVVLRIAVVGLMGNQQQEIAKAFGKKVDLRFISKELTKPSFPQCDHIILMTKFISHSFEYAANNTLPRDRVHLVRGGLTELTTLINSLIPKVQIK